jgi:predicted AlkP superfamily pyrophosphatase or phosphodiesterase
VDNSSVILVADGLTPATLASAVHNGDVPELAALAANGEHVITTVFPSVTGVAYIPMLTGTHPAESGVPGLRWYDRSRGLSAFTGYSRSYVGTQIRAINDDVSPSVTTLFELAGGNALGAESMITRGLPKRNQIDRRWRYSSRVVHAHVTGNIERWCLLEQEIADELVARIRRERPRFVFAAFTAGDKATHARGATDPTVLQSLKLIDHVVGSIRRIAEADGRWSRMQLWVVSDHGHSAVSEHLDLADEFRSLASGCVPIHGRCPIARRRR